MAMEAGTLKDRLEHTREAFAEEGTWMRFLIESYTGSGGYQGRVRQPASGFWGYAAEVYGAYSTLTRSLSGSSTAETTSYLDRFPREDSDKYSRRVNVAHYLNYVRPTTNLMISYIVRKPLTRANVPKEIADWIERTGYDKDFRRRALVTAVLGWFPMLVDMPRAPATATTQAQAGKLDPYVVLSLPCHLRDYQLDEQGNFVWAKMAHTFTERPVWDQPAVKVTRYTIWTARDFTVYECRGDSQEPGEATTGPHSFGQVPIVAWRADTSVEDHVKADSVNADIALEGRRLFNLVSELDEHIRSQVFALLIYPTSSPTGGDDVEVGASNGLQVSGEQKNLPFFLAPPATVAATLEARIEKSVIEMYRMRRVEYERASGTESSAQSKQQNFEQTNLSIADLAGSLAKGDRETLVLVGRGLGVSQDKLDAIEVLAADSYASEDLNLELEQVTLALAIRELGKQVRVEMLTRLAQKLLPHLSADTKKVIEAEIAEAVAQAEKDAALMQEQALAAESDGGDEPPGGDDEDDDEQEAAE